MDTLDPYSIDSSINTAYPPHTTLNPPDTSFATLRVGTLNCRGLTKTAASSVRQQFIRYLRTCPLDLLALQETHAASTTIQDQFHLQFQAKSSIWSQHCGLVTFSPDISFSNTIVSICGRIISTTISHASHAFEPFFMTVVYFPAARSERNRFLSTILTDFASVFSSSPSRSIILGDFNYTYSNASSSRNRQAPAPWLQYLDDHFVSGITAPGATPAVTFQRGSCRSCIDYVFLSSDLQSSVQYDKCRTSYIQPAWSDHLLLSCHLQLYPATDASSTSSVGKGLWRAHPLLASNSLFRRQLHKALCACVASLEPSWSAAQKWEELKHTTAAIAKSFSRRNAYTLKRAEDLLHKKRSGIQQQLSSDPALEPVLSPQLSIVEAQLASIQQYHVETLALRSGIRWREQGEKSAGFLKKSSSIRAAQTLIPPLIHPTTQSLCTSKEEMLDAAATYYGALYTPDPIDMSAVHDLLDAVPASARLSAPAAQSMVEPITYDDLCDAFSRAPTTSSPGMDGLPYQLVHLIVTNPACREIALATFNNALSHSDLPPSWLESCVVLLPKNGPPELLKNWRPISLINTDAKVFTRILSNRMIDRAASLINPFQTGFVRGRFIADNGLLMKLVMEHARASKSHSIGLLLDQEKAYDRVHPVYLRAVLLRFGFPVALVDCISHLFFDNHLVVNVNGFLSPSVPQLRGLKQGDPISPILFNLAFEPLLRKILQDPLLSGFQLPSLPSSPSTPSAVKMMAYADDVVCLLSSPAELARLHSHLSVYSAASNALVNYHKTEAISLSGSARIYASMWRTPLLAHRITTWHDAQSPTSVRYLGFPLCTSIPQRNAFLEQLLDKIRLGCQIHKQRGLSVRGRATVLNSLVLSKLWHVLRVLSVPVSFLDSVQSVISQFVNFRISPRISHPVFFGPRQQGGLGILNPKLQQHALQLRWLEPLLRTPTAPLLTHASIVLPRLVGYLGFHLATSADPPPTPPPPLLDHRLSLLFPGCRPAICQQMDSAWFLLFKAMDRLPTDFSSTVISAATSLALPLSSVVLSVSPDADFNHSYSRLPVSIAYTLDPTVDHCLRPKTNREISIHPNLAKKFLRLVRENDLRLVPFFVRTFIQGRFAGFGRFPFAPVEDHRVVDASPFVHSLFASFSSSSSRVQPCRLSTRSYRKLCSPASLPPPPSLPLPFNPSLRPCWSTFWSLPLSHSCRNVWYRFLYHRIPHRSLLHPWKTVPSPSCAICHAPQETMDHFLFSCPVKLAVWQQVHRDHLDTDDSISPLDLHLLLFTFRSSHVHSPSALRIIAATLESIWLSHWSFIFNDTPFTTTTVLALVAQKIRRSNQESFLAAGLPHAPLPFFSLDDT